MKLLLGEVAAVQPAAALELHEHVREALKKALSETLLRMTARENLEALRIARESHARPVRSHM